MHIRRALTGTVLGTVLAIGAIAVPAHAAQPQPAAQSANIVTSPNGPGSVQGYIVGGTYVGSAWCEAARAAQPGPANHPSYCMQVGAAYYLFIWI
ncbi:hypothetical protein PH213_23330 [Streptomyces sp. SRF1]|uniref:hypothetical protein n=1 Tax=Streptomyces sp. SRF1 TaxID=1549642 RepID=UPI0025B11B83|nr:hypothetical protein [Streptomyces sp. SRF1]MDN3057429.1 hypothetical protein [Streptomyces sp. SRF1]